MLPEPHADQDEVDENDEVGEESEDPEAAHHAQAAIVSAISHHKKKWLPDNTFSVAGLEEISMSSKSENRHVKRDGFRLRATYALSGGSVAGTSPSGGSIRR